MNRSCPDAVDLDSTAGCPRREQCDLCGSLDEIVSATTLSSVGVACLALCRTCQDRDSAYLPFLSNAEQVIAHCAHLGIDLAQMRDILRQEGIR